MKQIRIGDIPLEFFTGVGELRSHDKACNNLTAKDLLMHKPVERIPIDRQIVLLKRRERKEAKRLAKLGINYTPSVVGRGVSVRNLIA